MRKMTPVGKLSLYLGCIFIFGAALLALALYMDDQTASWFEGVSTSVLWPIDIILAAMGVVAIMFFLRWGREPRPVDSEVLHFTTLLDVHDIKHPIDEESKPEEPASTEHLPLRFESEVTEQAENEEKHDEEFESEEP